MSIKKLLLLGLLLFQCAALWADSEFPHRSVYAAVKTIELEALYAQRDQVNIIDARSAYEFHTLHIKEALNIPLSDKKFVDRVKLIRKTDNRPIIFYCNGHNCRVSYLATQKAMFAGIGNVFAYDAGIMNWTKAYPDEAVLLGETPVDLERLISKKKLNEHMLRPADFAKRVGDNAITLDIRDRLQTSGIKLFPTRQRSVPLDNKRLKFYINKAIKEKKTLLVYDAVGTQVPWLQYYLEHSDLTDYYFMKGGVKGFLKPNRKGS